jgi:hypothetical protein
VTSTPSLLTADTVVHFGKAGFLPEEPAKNPAKATCSSSSLLAAAGKASFSGPYADLHVGGPARRSPARVFLAAFARFVDWLMDSAERARCRELERHLGKSVDLYDLERRLRELERDRHPIFGTYV